MHYADIFLQSERQLLRDNTAYSPITHPRSRGISPSTCLSDCRKTPAWSKICLSHCTSPHQKPRHQTSHTTSPRAPITRPHTPQAHKAECRRYPRPTLDIPAPPPTAATNLSATARSRHQPSLRQAEIASYCAATTCVQAGPQEAPSSAETPIHANPTHPDWFRE